MAISNKIKGLFRVSAANFIALGATMLTSLVLPLAISVEQYGYWQLYSLYLSYIGFFVLGFNDGIHLNYASCDYDSEFQSKFKTFFSYLGIVSIIETILLIGCIVFSLQSDSITTSLAIIVAFNLFPTALQGLFLYMNQGTLRFKEYSLISVIDKIAFLCIMTALLVYRVQNVLYYIVAFTITRYLLFIYIYISAKDVFKAHPKPFSSVVPEIRANYIKGFPLMIAGILGGPSLIVGGRLLIQNRFGIEEFSEYSFSLNTIVIAAQFISAVATVFYPLLKRATKEELPTMYRSFDKVTTLFSVILLLTYYPAALLVNIVYVKYNGILAYLFLVYPLFIYQCKSNVLIVNAYKVKNEPWRLIIVNIIGIAIHLVCIGIAYFVSRTVSSIAAASLISLALWYYIIQTHILKVEGWAFRKWMLSDAVLISLFVLYNIALTYMFEDVILRLVIGLTIMTLLCGVIYLVKKNEIMRIAKEFVGLMRD